MHWYAQHFGEWADLSFFSQSVNFTSDESRRYRGYEIIVDVVPPRQLPISSFVSLNPGTRFYW